VNSMPIAHRVAYHYSKKGFIGSSHIWRIARKLGRQISGEMVTLPSGFPLLISKSDWIARTIYEGTYERPLLKFLSKVEVEGTFIDVGANIGVTLWSGMKGSSTGAEFIAVEPSQQCQNSLTLVSSLIEYSGRIVMTALGETNEEKTMYGLNNPQQSGGASLLNHFGLKGERCNVQVQTLDDLLSQHSPKLPVYMLKVDTEGFEEQVLEGSKRLISGNSLGIYILEVSPSFSSTKWVKDLHNDIGTSYTFFKLVELGFFLKKMRIKEIDIENAIIATDQWNLVIIRNDLLQKFHADILKVNQKI
jgi:FkbM family methyltransferase